MTAYTTAVPRPRIAVVGLEFGAEFVPIYRDHPDVAEVWAVDLDRSLADRTAERFDATGWFGSLDDALADPRIDAVHIVTGLPDHGDHVVAALEAGKHVACTVPMALSFEDIERIIDARRRRGLIYMMMETAVFTREYLYARALLASGTMGPILYARGTHFQDMTGWPSYWTGLPPLYYATHAIAPILQLLGTRALSARGMGARGPSRAEQQYGNPFSVETAFFELATIDVVLEATRSLYDIARAYTESFAIYGARQGFEWPQLEMDGDEPVLFTMGEPISGKGRPVHAERVTVPDRADLLPTSIQRYTRRFVYGTDDQHRSFTQGGGHGGSHPHLVHEFVTSMVEGRVPAVDDMAAANWTAAGIAAHESACAGGERIAIPSFA